MKFMHKAILFLAVLALIAGMFGPCLAPAGASAWRAGAAVVQSSEQQIISGMADFSGGEDFLTGELALAPPAQNNRVAWGS
jgi:hypothetical protein